MRGRSRAEGGECPSYEEMRKDRPSHSDTGDDLWEDSAERPVLNGNMNLSYIEDLMEKRRPKYEAAADITVATDGKTAEEICEEILGKCGK